MGSNGLRVLLVGTDRDFASRMFGSVPPASGGRLEGITCARLAEALSRLMEAPRIDAVLLDLQAEESAGWEALVQINQQCPALPVVVVTPWDDVSQAREATRLGACACLPKSDCAPRLLATLLPAFVERARAGEALRHCEERLLRLLRSTTEYHFSVTVENGRSVATRHGPGCLALTGWTLEQFDADAFLWYRLIHEQDRPRVMAQVEQILAGQTPPPIEHRLVHKNGSPRWVRTTPVLHKDHSGRLLGYDALVADINERKRAERLLGLEHAITFELASAGALPKVLAHILRSLCEGGAWDLALYWPLDAAAGVFRFGEIWHSAFPPGEEFVHSSRACTFASGVGLIGRVWERGEPVWASDIAGAEDEPRAAQARQVGLHGACVFSIRSGRECFGVIELLNRAALPADESLMVMLGAVGSQIGQFFKRKRVEEQQRFTEARLQAILDNSPAVIYLKDTQGRYQLVNRRFEELFHVTDRDLAGKTDHDIFPPDAADAFRRNDQEVLKSLGPLKLEEVAPQDGALHTYISVKFPICDAAGLPCGVCGISTDITDRKRAEQALADSQERLELVICGSNDGIWDWNVTTDEVYYSPRWKSMLGYADHEIENRFASWENLMHPEDRERAMATVQAYFSGRAGTYELEHRLRHQDGTYRWILARGVAQRDAAGRPLRMAGSHVDLTERKLKEQQLKQANDALARQEEKLRAALARLKMSHRELKATQSQLVQAEKLKSIGKLAAGVAHEVKNPLQTILMGLTYLTNNLPSPDATVQMVLNEMRTSIERADAIVRELLELSAATHIQPRTADLNRVIEQSLERMRLALSEARIRVVRVLARPLPPAFLDVAKIEQVFINLIQNSIHAMAGGGTLTVSTRAERCTKPPLSKGALPSPIKAGDLVLVAEVQDTGSGIPADILPLVFDPFFTTKPVGVGTGLGLSVINSIVELHGGFIELNNAPEGGVVATLTFKTSQETSLT